MSRALGLLALAGLLALVAPASALIANTTPLSKVLDGSALVFTVTVQELDAKRPSMVLKVAEQIKGKAPFDSLPVLLEGDRGAKKRKEPAQLLERVAVRTTAVAFVTEQKQGDKVEYFALVYVNGTWFNLAGVPVEKEYRWSFGHLEPVLRKTFKGTTAEMTKTVKDVLAGKAKAPPPDDKEPPGIGPKLDTKGALDDEPRRRAVIAPILVGGPLMVLAMLFPAAFGGWKRFLVLLSVGGTNATLYSLHLYFADQLMGTWWGSPAALWAVMGAVNVVGVFCAWQRHLALAQAGLAEGRPGRIETLVLCLLAVLGLAALATFHLMRQPLFSQELLPAVAVVAAVCVGSAYALYRRLRPADMTPAVATEAVVLTGLVAVGLLLGTTLQAGAARALTAERGEAGEQGEKVRVKWKFRAPTRGMLASSPLAAGGRIYIAAAHDEPVSLSYGSLYCLDRETGELLWTFDDNREMQNVYSTPTLADGKLFIGEGFHHHKDCRVFCIDAETGKKVWEFETASHTESTPVVVGGRVYFGAGDDGVYCLEAATGKKLWHFPGFHVDARPLVVAGRVYAGCGEGDVYAEKALLCLDAVTGKLIRRLGTDLPVWGRPVVEDGFIYAGTGNGRANQAAPKPAGKMLCLRESDGEIVWQKKYADGILATVVADRRNVYIGCRDGGVYGLRRSDGELAWRVSLGSPVVATPAVDAGGPASRLYAVAFEGRLACLDSRTGKPLWSRDLSVEANVPVQVMSSPALVPGRDADGTEVNRLYVAATLVSTGRVGELTCFEDRTVGE